ncbi:unnamed protein product [Effrenium voratum]|uniref:Uncharacterized protein n=1 Tax=Effrenium voratum TaxID=2562239 RepID=A0AA36JLJ6_9DINO|nr:unnamed protein product [Effrenium voratum]
MGLLDGSPSSASDASELFEAEEVLAPEVSAKGLRAGVPPAPASPEAAEAPLDVAPGAKDAPGEASDDSTESADERPAEPSPGPLGPEEVEERADLLLQQFGLAPPARPEPLPSAEPSEPPLRPEPPQEDFSKSTSDAGDSPNPNPPEGNLERSSLHQLGPADEASPDAGDRSRTPSRSRSRSPLRKSLEAAQRRLEAKQMLEQTQAQAKRAECSELQKQLAGQLAELAATQARDEAERKRRRIEELTQVEKEAEAERLARAERHEREALREASLASEPSDSSRPPPLSPEGQEEAFSWLQDQLVCLKSMQPAALQRLADDVHKKLMRRAGAEGVYRAMELFSETFKLASESTRRTVFFALNELCRPLRKEPVSRYSKLVRHACWTFLKNITAVDMSAKERQFLTRFLRQHSSTRDEPSFIWRAAGDHSAETKDWQQRLARWEAAVMGRQSLLEVQDQMSTYQLQQMTGDGLVLAMVRTRDQTLETNQREELAQEVLQLVLVFLLHIASLFLQFGLTYHLYITTVDGLAAPFDEGVGAYMQVIQQAVEQDPPHALSKDNDVQKDALDLCVKQHAMGYVHLMVLSLWAARMVAEISELLNRLTILSLIADPTNEPLARAFLQEREDGRMLIAYMGRRMKVAVITLCILPKLGCTIFLMWTGGKLFMLTYTMGSLIIPLLTLTYILQIPSILFTGFSSFKFKDQCPAGSRSKASEILRRLFATF